MTRALDVRGKTITTYIAYQATEALRDMDDGKVLEIRTDDTEAVDNDLQAWCQATGNRLLSVDHNGHERTYWIEKHTTIPRQRRSLALVISNAGLEELLSPLAFALAAALEGADVSIYFQGPAVKVLSNGFTPRLRGLNRPFSRFARRDLSKIGHVSPHEKLAELRRLGAHMYACGPSMQHFKVREDDLIFDDVVVAAYLTFIAVMLRADVHLFVQ